jgi:hypothetical protein
MFSSPSYAEWMLVSKNGKGDTFYIDPERIRKNDGFVYYWRLSNKLKPTEQGIVSAKFYSQADCTIFRFKNLSASFHKEPMGGGIGKTSEPKGDHKNWNYPSPSSVNENILESVCNIAIPEWELVANTTGSIQTDAYIDRSTIKQNADNVKIWIMYDNSSTLPKSFKVKNEYNCKEEEERGLAYIQYAGYMGRGKIIWSNYEQQEWESTVPGSISYRLMKIACEGN